MSDAPDPHCPHCLAYIGVAVRSHAALCQSINAGPSAVTVIQHDGAAAEKGECECPVCRAEREPEAWV